MQNDVREKQYLFSTADQDIFFTSDLHLGHTNKTGKRGCDSERVRSMCTPTMYDVGVDFNDFTPVRFQDVKVQIARQKSLRMNFVELYEYDHSSRLKQFFLRLRNRLSK